MRFMIVLAFDRRRCSTAPVDDGKMAFSMPHIHRALVSVTDKTGIVDFARALSRLGVEIVSTGGTYRVLKDAGIAPLREVAEVTGFPEMLDGRVKTIHPRIAAGMLAMRSKPEHMRALEQHGIPPIDLVCVNLYEFEKIAAKKDATLEELIENIDIGGPTMIRAAAKNWQDVAVVTSPGRLRGDRRRTRIEPRRSFRSHALAPGEESVRRDGRLRSSDFAAPLRNPSQRARLCRRRSTFARRASFALRYGENPHQSAALYATGRTRNRGRGAASWQGAFLQQPGGSGRSLAVDLRIRFAGGGGDQAHQSVRLRGERHAGGKLRAARLKPILFRPTAVCSRSIARWIDETAAEIAKTFIEAIAAPGYSEDALRILSARRRTCACCASRRRRRRLVVKSISGGFLAQTPDTHRLSRCGNAGEDASARRPRTNGRRSNSAGRSPST